MARSRYCPALMAMGELRLDPILRHTPFLVGERPVYADFLLHGILSNLTWKAWNPLPPLSSLAGWYARLTDYDHA